MHQTMMIHESQPLSPIKSPENILFNHHRSASFPVISVVIVGILATSFLLVFYYVFVIRCCLNGHHLGILRRFFPPRNHPTLPFIEPRATGLDEAVIRSIPVLTFRRAAADEKRVSCECAVCLNEFQEGEKLRIIPNCAHVFHVDCIDIWLQNNPNCPLCRATVSSVIALKPQNPHYFSTITSLTDPPPLSSDAANHYHDNTTSPSNIPRDFNNEDYVVIDLPFCGGGVDDSSDVHACLGAQDSTLRVSMVPRKIGKEKRRGLTHVSSMGDECIDIDTSGDQFQIKQPIRRSFSMDSASDQKVYSMIREILQHKNARQNTNEDCCEVFDHGSSEGYSSSSRGVKRSTSFFSFGHGRGSRSAAVLPVLHFDSPQTLDR